MSLVIGRKESFKIYQVVVFIKQGKHFGKILQTDTGFEYLLAAYKVASVFNSTKKKRSYIVELF